MQLVDSCLDQVRSSTETQPTTSTKLTLSLRVSKSTFSQPFEEKYIVRIGEFLNMNPNDKVHKDFPTGADRYTC